MKSEMNILAGEKPRMRWETITKCGQSNRDEANKTSEIKSAKHKNLLHMKQIEIHNRVPHILGAARARVREHKSLE